LNDLITAFDISMLESICTLEEELSVWIKSPLDVRSES
jgi:hypothetical protein